MVYVLPEGVGVGVGAGVGSLVQATTRPPRWSSVHPSHVAPRMRETSSIDPTICWLYHALHESGDVSTRPSGKMTAA